MDVIFGDADDESEIGPDHVVAGLWVLVIDDSSGQLALLLGGQEWRFIDILQVGVQGFSGAYGCDGWLLLVFPTRSARRLLQQFAHIDNRIGKGLSLARAWSSTASFRC